MGSSGVTARGEEPRPRTTGSIPPQPTGDPVQEIKGQYIRIEGAKLQQHCQLRAEHHKTESNKAVELFKEAKEFFAKQPAPERTKDISKFSSNYNRTLPEVDPLEVYRSDAIIKEKRAAYFTMWSKHALTDAFYLLTDNEAEELELSSIYRRKLDLD